MNNDKKSVINKVINHFKETYPNIKVIYCKGKQLKRTPTTIVLEIKKKEDKENE